MFLEPTIVGGQRLEPGTGCGEDESLPLWNLVSTETDIAEIQILMSLKGVDEDLLEMLMETNSVQRLEELDILTLRNFLHYLRSL